MPLSFQICRTQLSVLGDLGVHQDSAPACDLDSKHTHTHKTFGGSCAKFGGFWQGDCWEGSQWVGRWGKKRVTRTKHYRDTLHRCKKIAQ
jgi:hypothetical protein